MRAVERSETALNLARARAGRNCRSVTIAIPRSVLLRLAARNAQMRCKGDEHLARRTKPTKREGPVALTRLSGAAFVQGIGRRVDRTLGGSHLRGAEPMRSKPSRYARLPSSQGERVAFVRRPASPATFPQRGKGRRATPPP